MRPDRVLVVLHRPSSADNVGAAARVMKNFGLSRLSIVAPPAWSGPARSGTAASGREDVLARARVLARRASDLLEAAEVKDDARAALADAAWVCGTTSRTLEGRPRLTPRELAVEVARRSENGTVAVLFGEERRGLSDEELELCQAACTIPTSPAYDSMNLAQAVAVVCYEISQAGQAPLSAPPPPEPARHATLEAFFARLETLLATTGYLNPQNPTQILADFRLLLARAEPSQREVELLAAAVKSVDRQLRQPR